MLTTSTAAGYYPALYLGGGYRAVVIGAMALGLILALLARLSQWVGGPLFSGIFLLSLVPFALRLEEQWTVMALSAPIIMFIYSYLIYLVVVFLIRFRTRQRPHPERQERRYVGTAPSQPRHPGYGP
jgi:phosphotransferase system  glucose/maltose/N-acetylglucosamine-specific IIC component